jgi:hypothetical protein
VPVSEQRLLGVREQHEGHGLHLFWYCRHHYCDDDHDDEDDHFDDEHDHYHHQLERPWLHAAVWSVLCRQGLPGL